MTLSAKDTLILSADLRSNVVTTLAGLRPFIGRDSWLSATNRYSGGASQTLKRETKTLVGGQRVAEKPKELAQYIAASCLLHCSDGWGYLGKALLAFLRGDPHRARHLAYYAELRAAMSLLAAQGVGVFNGQHAFVDAPDSVSEVLADGGTHSFVWDCLLHWSALNWSGVLFASVVTPHQRSLGDWMHAVGGTMAFQASAGTWLREWGMDLHFATKDREARNESSYLPDGLPQPWYVDVNEALTLVSDMWGALAIDAQGSFAEIDQHILRLTLERSFVGLKGKPANIGSAAYREFIGKIISDQAFEGLEAQRWKGFLLREEAPDDLSLLKYSSQQAAKPDFAHPVVARAALLLRIASGSVAQLFRTAGFTGNDIEFWWSDLGSRRGLWRGSKQLDDLLDLGADIAIHLEDITNYQHTTPSADQNFHDIGEKIASSIVALSGCERIGIVSMTPR